MTQKRILVPVTFGDRPDAAFERALALARTSGAELYLLHAVPADQRYSFNAAQRLQRSMDLRRRAEAAGATVQIVEQQGDPAEIIVLHAESRQVDLIIMASERRTGWDSLRKPSVAKRVVRGTKRPTVVVSGDETDAVFENALGAAGISSLDRQPGVSHAHQIRSL
jgi:nucleotide-binding universal stress UspA family protein